jgi:DNA-binding CsgD family transcriptional regulator
MVKDLQSLFQTLANARDENALKQVTANKIAEYFHAEYCGIYFFDKESTEKIENQPIPSACIESNPVFGYLFERHAPVHEGLVLSPENWKDLCKRSDHEHVMTGPIVVGGIIVGSINLTRITGSLAFDNNDLADLGALCLHISASLASLRAKPKTFNSSLTTRLTARELEIAKLIAQGLTNAEIGEKLWIQENSVKQALKRMFRKVQVSSRAELVGRLSDI